MSRKMRFKFFYFIFANSFSLASQSMNVIWLFVHFLYPIFDFTVICFSYYYLHKNIVFYNTITQKLACQDGRAV